MKCREISIGALYPLTGSRQLIGRSIRNALEFLVELIILQDQYCLSNLDSEDCNGFKIRLVWGDTQGDPIIAQNEARRLIECEGVTSIIGCYQSAVTSAVAYQTEIYNIPFLNPDSDASALTKRNFRWFFRTGPDSVTFTKRLFDMVNENGFDEATVGNLSQNSFLGNDETQALIHLSEKFGHKIKVVELYDEIGMDAFPRIKSCNPHLLVIPQDEEDDLVAIKKLTELGYCPIAYLDQTGFFAIEQLLQNAGKNAEYVISTAAWEVGLTRKLSLARIVNDLYKTRYGENMNSVNALSFTGLYVLTDAIARARSGHPSAIREALMNTDIPGDKLILPWKGIRFDAAGQNIFANSMVVQVLNGTNQIVWPDCLAEAKAVLPYPCD